MFRSRHFRSRWLQNGHIGASGGGLVVVVDVFDLQITIRQRQQG